MGGFGSGRKRSTQKVEELRSLDVNKLHRAGAFVPGQQGWWQWSCDGEVTASINYRMEDCGLRLLYRTRQNGADWEDVDYVVPIRYRPCHFGGQRPYFVCPSAQTGSVCGRTVVKLYGGTRFLCRHCQQLGYASQSEGPLDRTLRRADKIRMRLGGDPGMGSPLPKRPKGMRHLTYKRLLRELLMAEFSVDEAIADRLDRM